MSIISHEKIWNTIAAIPSGKVAGYGHVAALAGLPGRARMVGKVIGLAPATMTLPWQRVLRSSGEIAFPPDSESAHRQIKLLTAEGVLVKNNRVSMAAYKWQPSLDELFALGFKS